MSNKKLLNKVKLFLALHPNHDLYWSDCGGCKKTLENCGQSIRRYIFFDKVGTPLKIRRKVTHWIMSREKHYACIEWLNDKK